MSRKDFEPGSIALTLGQLLGRIEFKKSGYTAFLAAFLLTFIAAIASRFN